MDGKSGESTEKEVIGAGKVESELDRLEWGWWSEAGSWF